MLKRDELAYPGYIKGVFLSLVQHEITIANAPLLATYVALNKKDRADRLFPFYADTLQQTPGEAVNETLLGGVDSYLYDNADGFVFEGNTDDPDLIKQYKQSLHGKQVYAFFLTSDRMLYGVYNTAKDKVIGFPMKANVSYGNPTDALNPKLKIALTGYQKSLYATQGAKILLNSNPLIDFPGIQGVKLTKVSVSTTQIKLKVGYPSPIGGEFLSYTGLVTADFVVKEAGVVEVITASYDAATDVYTLAGTFTSANTVTVDLASPEQSAKSVENMNTLTEVVP